MGLNDAREQLEVCKADAVQMEHALMAISEAAGTRLRATDGEQTLDRARWTAVKRIADEALTGKQVTA